MSPVLTRAFDDGLIEINPAALLPDAKKNDVNPNEPLSWKEKATFEQEMLKRSPRYYPFFVCALRSGMREGELIALKPGDIDFEGGFIELRRNGVRSVISTPKTGRTQRVDMSAQLAEVLKVHLINSRKETLQSGWE